MHRLLTAASLSAALAFGVVVQVFVVFEARLNRQRGVTAFAVMVGFVTGFAHRVGKVRGVGRGPEPGHGARRACRRAVRREDSGHGRLR